MISIVAVAVVDRRRRRAGRRRARGRRRVLAGRPAAAGARGGPGGRAADAGLADVVRRGHLAGLSPIDDVRGHRGVPLGRRSDAGPARARRGRGVIADGPTTAPTRGQRRAPSRSTPTAGGASSTSCARTSGSPGPRSAATPATAARARSGSTASRCLVPRRGGPGGGAARRDRRGPRGAARSPPLQAAFLACGGAQCGACTPGMLMAADDLLARSPSPTDAEVLDGLGGVLCRCTGYTAILEAVRGAAREPSRTAEQPAVGHAVGARIARTDGVEKVTGSERFGDDLDHTGVLAAPRRPLAARPRTVHRRRPRSLHERHPGLVRVLAAADVPGDNLFGIYATGKDQPVLADGLVRFRARRCSRWSATRRRSSRSTTTRSRSPGSPRRPLMGIDAALAPEARPPPRGLARATSSSKGSCGWATPTPPSRPPP